MRSLSRTKKRIALYFRKYQKVKIVLALLVCLFSLGVCWSIGNNKKVEGPTRVLEIPADDAAFQEKFPYLAITELDQSIEGENVKQISLADYEDKLVISEGGEYLLNGEIEGSIVIQAKEQNVHLYLDNINITAKEGPAIYCEEADKLIITLLADSENYISDSGSYLSNDELEACVYSICDITLNGSGKLTVNGYYKDALRSKDIVKILDGTYSIKCKRTGIRGNDGILINGGNITISSEKYGLMTTKAGAEGRGNLIVSGGNLTTIAGRYSFVTTKGNLLIYNCSVQNRSIVDTYDIGGIGRVQKGCVQ